VVSFTPLSLYPRERVHGTQWIGGWVGPRAGLDDVENRKYWILPGHELQALEDSERDKAYSRHCIYEKYITKFQSENLEKERNLY
jgi:hypothetical protein